MARNILFQQRIRLEHHKKNIKNFSRIKILIITLIASSGLVAAAAIPAFAASGGSPASGWHLGYYTPSGNTLSFAQADSAASGIATFNFTNQPNVALLVTDQKAQNSSLLGNLTGESVTATGTVSGVSTAASFIFGGPDYCGTNTSFVRYYFETSNAGGFSYNHYWWSNPVHVNLTGNEAVNLASVPFTPSNWSNWDGENGTAEVQGFNAAVGNVTKIGLSFGGDCFFENGVGTSDGSGQFTLDTFNVN